VTDDKHTAAPTSIRCSIPLGWAWMLVGLAIGYLAGAGIPARYREVVDLPYAVVVDRWTGTVAAYRYVSDARQAGSEWGLYVKIPSYDPPPVKRPR